MTGAKMMEKIDTRVLLSSLWIVVMLNMLKADILSLYIPGATAELVQFAGATPIPLLMLGAAVIMAIAIHIFTRFFSEWIERGAIQK